MPNTVDVTCKIIPLYRVRIMIEDEKHNGYEYERHIVADSLQGLIEGIVDAELFEDKNFEDEDVRMTFDIQDFLLMPCKGSRCREYHLFDIDEVDCATRFASIDNEIWYDIRFSRDKNVSRYSFDPESAAYSEPLPVSAVVHHPGREGEYEELRPIKEDEEFTDFKSVENEWKYRDSIMMALYHMAQASEYRSARLMEMAREEAEQEAKAKKHILEVIAEEADRNARDAVATRNAGQVG